MSTPTLERPTVGSLCSGYGGLDLAVEEFFGARTAWFSEFDPAPSKILAHRWPDVPNLGDMTRIDWSTVEPVDIIAGGTPCQDLSGAGKRQGMTEGTRSNLWVQMREAVAVIRPSVVIWENVRGAFSAYAYSEVELEEGLLGVAYGPGRPALRALHRVLGDLSDLGYDTEWVGLRAADAGAPHARHRVFVVAYPKGNPWRINNGNDVPVRRGTGLLGAAARVDGAANPERLRREEGRGATPGQAIGRGAPAVDHRPTDASVPDTNGERGNESNQPSDGGTEGRNGSGVVDERTANSSSADVIWGDWEPAIRRWERVSGVFAPRPTIPTGRDGAERANPAFGEWMMSIPAGHVTSPEIGLTWQQQWTAIGNGVAPAQAALAFSILWPRVSAAVSPVGGTQ